MSNSDARLHLFTGIADDAREMRRASLWMRSLIELKFGRPKDHGRLATDRVATRRSVTQPSRPPRWSPKPVSLTQTREWIHIAKLPRRRISTHLSGTSCLEDAICSKMLSAPELLFGLKQMLHGFQRNPARREECQSRFISAQ